MLVVGVRQIARGPRLVVDLNDPVEVMRLIYRRIDTRFVTPMKHDVNGGK